MKSIQLLSLLLWGGACLLPFSARAAQPEVIGPFLQEELAKASPDDKLPVIVRMHDPLVDQPFVAPSGLQGPARAHARAQQIRALQARAEQTRAPLQQLLARQGITESRNLWLINGIAFQASVPQIREMARMPGVSSIVFDQVIELPGQVTTQVSGTAESNIDLIKAPDLWALGYTGQGVTVAVMDTGVDIDHPDVGPRWRGGTNSWFDPNGEHPLVPVDRDGHGTLVSGVILGGNHSGAYIGVAPEAEWIGVKIFADNGLTTSSRIHAGFQWLLDPDDNPSTDDAPDIVNNSWGFEDSPGLCSTLLSEFRDDVQALKSADIAVVFAAGNTGPEENTSIAPGNYPESFAVGALGTASSATEISSFSGRGPSACDGTIYPEAVAPGFEILSSDLTSGGTQLNSYSLVSGTSFSAAHGSGVMALLRSAFPWRPVDDLEVAIKNSASDLGPAGADTSYGHGLIDALAAYNFLDGQAGIDVTDSISPERDHIVPFGSVAPNDSAQANVKVRNSGSLPLFLGTTDVANIKDPFSVTSDTCSGRSLPVGDTCTIDLRFTPPSRGSYTGSLAIISNAVGNERVTVTIFGTGNSPPVAPQPLTPLDGATVATSVTFRWQPASDPDGDAVAQYLVYSPHSDFSYATTREVDSVPAALLASGVFLSGGLLVLSARRHRRLAICLLLAGLLLAMAACGGGGGDGDSVVESQSTTVSGLVPGAVYYWKMVARDSHGAETQSAVRTIHVE